MRQFRTFAVSIVAVAVVASCGSEPRTSDSLLPTDVADSVPLVELPAVGAPLPRSQAVELDQPAIWPASNVVLATPEEAAASFVTNVLGVEPVLGDFMGGDSRSGEIQVFSPGEVEGADLVERGLLALRIIGPNDGWFVIAAGSQGVSIQSPETLDRVAAGPLEVTGEGRGFEGTLVVAAFRAGDAADVLDEVITRGGPFELLEPYTVTLDLSDGVSGETIVLIVRGDTGLDGDPGDFASIPVVVGQSLPPTH